MKIKGILLLVPLAGLLAGCGAISFDATCSNGHCTGTAGPASLQPSASIPGYSPPSSPSPLPAPTVTVTQTVYAGWRGCIPADELYLDSLAASPYGTSGPAVTLAACLEIPQGNQDQFVEQVEDYALIAQQSGLLGHQEGREEFAHGDNEITCPDGQVIYSLFQIYAQYGIAR